MQSMSAEGIAWIIRRWKESFAALKVNGFRKVVMVIAMQYANKSVDKCLLQRLSTSYKQWWFIALPYEEKWKQVIPVS